MVLNLELSWLRNVFDVDNRKKTNFYRIDNQMLHLQVFSKKNGWLCYTRFDYHSICDNGL